nr:hypothetical protein [Tanacetum cinerariifolium]
MSYDNLRELVRKLVHSPVHSLYNCKVEKTLKQGLCSLKNDDDDVQEVLKVGYESKWVVDLYVEHYGHDVMDFKISDAKDYESPDSSDAYCSSDDKEKGIAYPRHDPLQPWNEMQPILGMRDVSKERCAWYHSKKVKAKKQLFTKSNDDAKKGEGTSKDEEGSSRNSDLSGLNPNLHLVGKVANHNVDLGVKDGWKAGCRRVIGLDGYFLKHTCRGELLTAIGMDSNNQMYIIAWVVVKAENNENWKCTRHVFANFKKKFSRVQLQRLFWLAAGTTVESIFYNNMDQIKAILPYAYDYLIQRNPNSWSIAFFDLNSKCSGLWFQWFSGARGIPCVHSVAAYLFLNKEPDEEVDYCYSQENQPLLPPIFKRMPGRPKKNRVKARSKNNSQVSRGGRQITCSNCYEKRHNKRNCDKEPMPKPPQVKKYPGRKTKPNYPIYASNRGGGRGYRGGRGDASGGRGEASRGISKASVGIGKASSGIDEVSGGTGQASGGRGQSNAVRFQENTKRVESSGGRGGARGKGGRSGRSKGRGSRGQGKGGRGRGRGGTKMLVDEQEMSEDEIKKNIELEYMEQVLIKEEEKRIAAEKAYQEEFDEEVVGDLMRMHQVQRVEPIVSADPSVAANETTPKGKTIESNAAEPPNLKKQGRKRKVAEPSEAEPPFRIYHKNRGSSERIFNQKMKKTGFGPNGEGSTAGKAFLL